ncbi:MAG: phosphoenolpyruvate carboxylase [Opitutales bacterium]
MSDEPTMHPFRELVNKGLQQVDKEHEFLVKAFTEVLADTGEPEASSYLLQGLGDAWSGTMEASTVKAISFYFQLLNLAEEHTANSFRRIREQEAGPGAEPGHWGHYFERLKALGVSPDTVRERIATLQIEPVFTKHPTEAKNWAVLGMHREIFHILNRKEGAKTEFEKNECARGMRAILERLWLTGEIFLQKPQVQDELENLTYYLQVIFPNVVDRLDSRLKHAWTACWPESEPLSENELPSVRFGSWVGGDRDGHPKVTAEVTRQTLSCLRQNALGVLKERLQALSRQLSFSIPHVATPEPMAGKLAEWQCAGWEQRPWPAFVDCLEERLEVLDAGSLCEELEFLRNCLLEAQAAHTVSVHVNPLIRLVKTFGQHLARLDIRQNSDFYEIALKQMMEAAGIPEADGYRDWPREKKLEFLNTELSHPRPLTHVSMSLPAHAEEARASLIVLQKHIKRHGRNGLGALVVSMTRDLTDLLTLYVLCKEAGLTRTNESGLYCTLPVVPLFETHGDLEVAPDIMEAFIQHPCTQNSLSMLPPGERSLMIMLGYSDSNKDAGIIASQWGLREAQMRLLDVGNCNGIKLSFFHGRGGTVGRGSGPTHRFLEALPANALRGGLRITEQGEVIGQKYNSPASAAANLELLAAGSLGGDLLSASTDQPANISTYMNAMTRASKAAYRNFLEHPRFMEFYRQVTPIDAIEHSRIGSRPSRRTGQATLDDLRAIPWVFSWNQSRFYLPGWYGVGSALQHLESEYPQLHADLVQDLQQTAFLRYLFYNVESSLASSDAEWIRAYAGLVQDASLRNDMLDTILGERDATEAALTRLLGSPIASRRPRFCATLEAREGPLRKLHERQIALLGEYRANPASQHLIEELLLVINAIASGLRTTG